MSEWVSIKDRMPPIGVDVLCLRPSDTSAHYSVLHYDGSRGWNPSGLSLGWVSHWQELPPPPDEPIMVWINNEQRNGLVKQKVLRRMP